VLDLEKYSVKQFKKFDVFTVIWIGTPVTYKYLEQHLDALRMMTADNNCELLVIADENLGATRPLTSVNARYVSWSEASENELLARSHVGIMPLTDDEFSRGKSAFKLLQYQASGLPLLASPVGENNKVVLPGKNGFLCSNTADWSKAVQLLRNDQCLYEQYSSNARSMAYEYSLQKYFPVFCEFVEKSFKIKL
jgi:glycosyltransferase involved in cell wall biosynthesis